MNPFLELSREFGLGGQSAQVYGRAGVLGIVGGGNRSLTVGFAALPEELGLGYEVSDSVSPLWADVGLGFRVAGSKGWTLLAEGRTMMTPDLDQKTFSGSLKATQRF